MVNSTVEPVYAGVLEYKRPLGTDGLVATVTGLLSDFSITDPSTNVGTKGNSQSLEAGLSYPLHLVFGRNLYLEGSFADRAFTTQIDVTAAQKKNIVVGKLGLRGSTNDTVMWGYSGTNFANFYYYKGTVHPQDGYISNTPTDYWKETLSLARTQALPRGFNLYLNVNAQFSNSALDSSEKLSMGGATAVRAYDPTAIYSNKGFLFTVELNRDLGSAGDYGVIKSSVFYDEGISLSDDVYGGRNVLKGVGVSLALQKWGSYELRATYARPVNRSTMGTLSDDRTNSGRIWATLMLFF
jgi:hemolysin activation/secretion protein